MDSPEGKLVRHLTLPQADHVALPGPIDERANAQRELAQQNCDRQAELFEKKVIAQATLDTFNRNLETARRRLVGARARKERAPRARFCVVGFLPRHRHDRCRPRSAI